MAPVIKALRQESWAVVDVVSTGQHRELVHQTMGLFEIGIDYDLDVMQHNQSLAGLSGRIFSRLDEVLGKVEYDLVLVQGDTTSVMIASLAAFYRQIPVGHVEAGLRTHDLSKPFPEELNRRVTGLVTKLHFAPTVRAQRNLINESVDADTVHVTGNTVIDALLEFAGRPNDCSYPRREGHRLVLITAHRRENFGQPITNICHAISALHDANPDVEFVYPVHPNPNISVPVNRYLSGLDRVHLLPPVDYLTLVGLMARADLVLTDSGGIQEEAPALAKPVLVLREETERPEAVEAGVARLIGTDRTGIYDAVTELLSNEIVYRKMARGGSPYGDGHASQRIAKICRDYFGSDVQQPQGLQSNELGLR